MIKEFTMNKKDDIAIFKLGGTGFHQDLHRLCQIVKKVNRRFDGEYWHVKYASQYADTCAAWWPEFAHWVKDFENQMELPLDLDDDAVWEDLELYEYDPDWKRAIDWRKK